MNEILENAQSLLDSAIILKKKKQNLHAAHMSVLCLEECAKFLMGLSEIKELFKTKENYRHKSKGELIGVFHYIYGALSVVYVIKRAKNEKFLGGTEDDYNLLLNHLLEISGVSNGQTLAEIVRTYLELKLQPDAPSFKDGFKKYDEIRKHTVYCDYEGTKILVPKERISLNDINNTIEEANFAVNLLTMVIQEKFDWDKFIKIYPSKSINLKKDANKMIKNVRRKIEKSSRSK